MTDLHPPARPANPLRSYCNLLLTDLVVGLTLEVGADHDVGLLWIELVRSPEAGLPTARLVLGQDSALTLADRLAGTVLELRGQPR
jgi:hypothetical protein